MSLVKLAPKFLFFVAVAVLIAAIAFQAGRLAGTERLLAVSMVGGYLVWLVAEVPITFRGSSSGGPSSLSILDSYTLIPYALSRLATVAAASFAAPTWSSGPVAFVCVAVFVAAAAFRMTAIRRLGQFYSHHVARKSDQVIITTGLYRLIRHPAYAGMIVANLAFVGFFAHVASALCFFLLLAVVVWRIRVEERMLFTMPGYPEYAQNKARLCPGIW